MNGMAFSNMRLYKGMNQLQTKNQEVIVKHVQAKFSVQMLLIGQFFTENQSKVTWCLKDLKNQEDCLPPFPNISSSS